MYRVFTPSSASSLTHFKDLQNLGNCLSRDVIKYYGHLSKLGNVGKRKTGAIVCTIEKAYDLVNKLLGRGDEKDEFQEMISTVVVDELHMVSRKALISHLIFLLFACPLNLIKLKCLPKCPCSLHLFALQGLHNTQQVPLRLMCLSPQL